MKQAQWFNLPIDSAISSFILGKKKKNRHTESSLLPYNKAISGIHTAESSHFSSVAAPHLSLAATAGARIYRLASQAQCASPAPRWRTYYTHFFVGNVPAVKISSHPCKSLCSKMMTSPGFVCHQGHMVGIHNSLEFVGQNKHRNLIKICQNF
jgi:hypothetical protein